MDGTEENSKYVLLYVLHHTRDFFVKDTADDVRSITDDLHAVQGLLHFRPAWITRPRDEHIWLSKTRNTYGVLKSLLYITRTPCEGRRKNSSGTHLPGDDSGTISLTNCVDHRLVQISAQAILLLATKL